MPNCVGLQIPRDRKKLSDGKFLAVGCNTASQALSVLRLECVHAGKSCTEGKMMALLARDGFFAYCVVAQCFVVFENSRIVVKGKKIWRKVCGIFLILLHLQLPISLLPRDVVDVLLIFVLLIRIFPPLL